MKKQLSALLAAALCAGALAGCGANSNSANAATSGAEDTVTLAVVSPVTGDSAEYGIHFNVGAQMAADKINEAGGINGKQVVLKSFDSKNDAKEAAEVARLICQDKTILATIGDFSSTCCMATAPIYEENKTVQISPSAGLIDFPRVGPYNHRCTGKRRRFPDEPRHQREDGRQIGGDRLHQQRLRSEYAELYDAGS